jgi:hypothetical protein
VGVRARRSHLFDVGYEPIESRSPTDVEPHLLVLLSSGLIPVNGHGGVPCPSPSRFQRYDRREERILRGAIAGKELVGPDQSLIRNDFQIAANVGKLLSVRRDSVLSLYDAWE